MNKSDGKWVVMEGGRQVSGPFSDRASAEADRDRLKRLAESMKRTFPHESQLIEVKQILLG